MDDAEQIVDRMELANIRRRRQAEVERRERIFNEKWRTIGLDKQALDMQMMERKKLEDEENQNSRAYEAQMLHNQRIAFIQNIREEEKQRSINKEIVSFRNNYQQPYTRREYDLNDPDRLKKTKGDDARVSLCGLLGEDKEYYDRMQRQREQFNAWLQQQQTEQALERHKKKLEDQKHDQLLVDMDNQALLTQRRERLKRRETAMAINEHNLAKIEERRQRQPVFKDGFDLVDESSVGVPGLCPSKDRRPQPETKQDIMLFHKYQMEERKRREFKKKQEDNQHSFLLVDSANKALLQEKEQAERNRLVRQNMDIINVKLAEMQMGLKKGTGLRRLLHAVQHLQQMMDEARPDDWLTTAETQRQRHRTRLQQEVR